MMLWPVRMGWCSGTQLLVWHPCALLSPAALCKCRIDTQQNTFNAGMAWVCVCAGGSWGPCLGLPTCVLCTSASTALSWASPECPCFPQGASFCLRDPLPWERWRGAAGGSLQRNFVPFPVASGKPGSAQCQSCWPGWVLREKLSTELLTVFSEVLWLCVNILFLHFYNLQWFCSIAVIDSKRNYKSCF